MVQYARKSNDYIQNGKLYDTDIDMQNKIIINHDDPINDLDVANKRYVDNHTSGGATGITVTVSLTSTVYTSIITETIGVYNIKVISNVSNGPSAIFSICKNNPIKNIYGNRLSIDPGLNTNERLEIIWPANSTIQLRKTGSNYNGDYTVIYF